MTVLITGGTGFVGSAVATEILNKEKEKIVLFDYLPKKVNVSTTNRKYVEIVKGDTRNLDKVLQVCKDFDVDRIIHLAAIANVHTAEESPYQAYETNVNGLMNICEAARKLDVKRVVFSSSGAVYGRQKVPVSENARYQSMDFYSVTKIVDEFIALQYAKSYRIDILIDRLFFIYGPGMFFEPINPISIVKNAVEGKSSVIEDKKRLFLDLTYVTDSAQGIVLTLFSRSPEHQVFNISSGQAYTLNQLVDVLKKYIPGASVEIKSVKAVFPRSAPLDITRAKKELGYYPRVSLDEGIKRLIAWLKSGTEVSI